VRGGAANKQCNLWDDSWFDSQPLKLLRPRRIPSRLPLYSGDISVGGNDQRGTPLRPTAKGTMFDWVPSRKSVIYDKLIWIFFFAFTLRVALRWHTGAPDFWENGYTFFFVLAQNIAAGNGFAFTN
jgi:hypothetical protein